MTSVESIQPIGSRLRPEQVKQLRDAATSARKKLQRAIDLVIVHEGYTVSGPEPPAALNEPTVLAAVAAWDRFTDDLWELTRRKPEPPQGKLKGSYLVRPRDRGENATADETVPGDTARVLTGLLGTPLPLNPGVRCWSAVVHRPRG